jgi:hypothetical protein
MQITQDVRDDTETLNGKEQGIADMSKKFIDMLEEEEAYVEPDKTKEANKAL